MLNYLRGGLLPALWERVHALPPRELTSAIRLCRDWRKLGPGSRGPRPQYACTVARSLASQRAHVYMHVSSPARALAHAHVDMRVHTDVQSHVYTRAHAHVFWRYRWLRRRYVVFGYLVFGASVCWVCGCRGDRGQ